MLLQEMATHRPRRPGRYGGVLLVHVRSKAAAGRDGIHLVLPGCHIGQYGDVEWTAEIAVSKYWVSK